MTGMKPGMTRSEEMIHRGVGSTGSALAGASIDAVAWGAIIPILFIIASVGLSLTALTSFTQAGSLGFANLFGPQAADFTKSLFDGFKTNIVDKIWDTIGSFFESLANGLKSLFGFGGSGATSPASTGNSGDIDTSTVLKISSSTLAAATLSPRRREGGRKKLVIKVDASPLARIIRAVREGRV